MQRKGSFSPRRREALKFLLKKEGVVISRTGIPRRDGDRSRAPLSFAQQRLWFIHQMEPDSAAYNIPFALRLTGSLNIPALEQSLNEVARRHESLRTTFQMVDVQPIQVIAPNMALWLPFVDLRNLSETERESTTLCLIDKEAGLPCGHDITDF